jgi:hypothetical protein
MKIRAIAFLLALGLVVLFFKFNTLKVQDISSKSPRHLLSQACPGIDKYANDLTVGVAERQASTFTTNRDQGWNEVDVFVVSVSDTPSTRVFSDFKAQGQRCTFEVDALGRGVAIAKRACMAVCQDKPIQSYQPVDLLYVQI